MKSLLNEKNHDSEKDWGQKEKGVTEGEIVGWHHQLNGHEFQETPGDSEDREAWSAAVPGVANNWTWHSNWITARHTICKCFSLSLGFYFLYGVLWYTSLNFDEVQCIYSFFCYLYQYFQYISKKKHCLIQSYEYLCYVALVVYDSLQSYGLWPTRLLCPWDSLGKNT